MSSSDKYGNNAMHKACRFRNASMISMILESGIASISQRNMMGKTPVEMPHNDILNDLQIKQVFEKFLEREPQYRD